MNDSQRRELSNDIFHRSTGSFELVLSPLFLGLLGFWVDQRAGMAPLFTILFAFAGIAGAAARIFYGYRYAMAQLAEAKAELAAAKARTAAEHAASAANIARDRSPDDEVPADDLFARDLFANGSPLAAARSRS